MTKAKRKEKKRREKSDQRNVSVEPAHDTESYALRNTIPHHTSGERQKSAEEKEERGRERESGRLTAMVEGEWNMEARRNETHDMYNILCGC